MDSGSHYTDVYQLKNVDAAWAGEIVRRAYPKATVVVDEQLNAVVVSATIQEHDRIASALAQFAERTRARHRSHDGGSTNPS
jgi:hypothetical protein